MSRKPLRSGAHPRLSFPITNSSTAQATGKGCHRCRLYVRRTRNPTRLSGFRWLGSGMPLIGRIGMFRWGSRCGACVVLRIPREPRVKRSGFGQLVSGAGRRLVGSLGFGRVGVPVATWLGSPPAIYPNIGMVFRRAYLPLMSKAMCDGREPYPRSLEIFPSDIPVQV